MFFELTMHSDDRDIGKNTGIIRIIVAKEQIMPPLICTVLQ